MQRRTRTLRRTAAVAVVGASTIALALTGCASSDSGSGDDLTGTLTLLTPGGQQPDDYVNTQGLPVKGLTTLTDEFEKEHPGATIKIVNVPSGDWATKAQTMLLSNSVDLLYGSPWSYYNQGLVMDLTDRVAADGLEDDYLPGALRSPTRTFAPSLDQIVGLPDQMDVPAVAYDTKLFDDYGVEYLSDNPTIDEIVTKSKQLTGTDPVTGEQTYGLYIDGSWQNFLFMNYFLSADEQPHAEPGYPASYADTDIDWNSPEIAAAIADETEALKSAPPGFLTSKGGENWGSEANNVAILPWTYLSGMNAAAKNDLVDRFAVTNGVRFGDDKAYSALTSGWFIAKDTKHPDLAWEFAKFMTSAEGQQFYTEQYGTLPAWKDADWLSDIPYADHFYALGAKGGIDLDYTGFFSSDFRPKLNTMITEGLQGGDPDIPGSLDQLQQSWETWKSNN